MSVISIKNLNYFYGKKQILKNISLEINEKKLTGIIGPNGCGKSTLAKNIVRYISGDYENFNILGKDLKKMTSKEMAEIISYIPQKNTIIPNISVFEFVLLGRFPLLKNTWESYKKIDYEVVKKNIKLLEIENLEERKIDRLSGGELQKVLLAKALSQESKILLLDEPTSALDLNNAVEFMKILKQVSIKKAVTPIVIIHDLNLASIFCDFLIVLKEGEIIKQGCPSQIITEDNMKKIYNLECKVIKCSRGIPCVIPSY